MATPLGYGYIQLELVDGNYGVRDGSAGWEEARFKVCIWKSWDLALLDGRRKESSDLRF